MEPLRVGIIGTGNLGKQIAEVLLINGCQIIVKSRSEAGHMQLVDRLSDRIAKKTSIHQANELMEMVEGTTDYWVLKNCDIIIEAVPEDYSIKNDVIENVSRCNEGGVIGTNTSSLSINALSEHVTNPSRFLGIHFFNPVSKMTLVEIIPSAKTTEKTIGMSIVLAERLGKVPIVSKDTPGFIVNRLLLPQINEAALMVDQQTASPSDIDIAVKAGLNHPMGPLHLADLIGIDVCIDILTEMWQRSSNDYYRPADILLRLRGSGHLGVKSGEGFFKY